MTSIRPNILVLHTDAQPSHWLGCAGNSEVGTPHLDALAAEGTYFRNAYACSGVCAPSRAALMTGRYPIAYGMVNNFGKLPPSEETMGSLFSKGGYRTGYFGKTHYGRTNESMEDEGWQHRFLIEEYNHYLQEAGQPFTYPRDIITRSRTRFWQMGTSKIPLEHYFEKVLGDQTVDFMARKDERPFLAFLSMIAPHGPFSPPEPYDSLFDPRKLSLWPRSEDELEKKPLEFRRWVQQNQKYITDDELREFLAIVYGLTRLVDDTVGRVIQALKDSGQYENTVIVFASDHGDFGTKYGIFGKSWCMDDVLTRIPLIISHPGFRQTGKTSDALVENIDILPTLLEAAGITIPQKTQGCSLLPVLQGQAGEVKDAIFSFHSSEYSAGSLNLSMIRQGDWKLVQSDTGEDQLYDLANDPQEWNNQIGNPACTDTLTNLRLRLLQWHVSRTGQFYHSETTRFWADETFFFDESRFTGERKITRSGEWRSATS